MIKMLNTINREKYEKELAMEQAKIFAEAKKKQQGEGRSSRSDSDVSDDVS